MRRAVPSAGVALDPEGVRRVHDATVAGDLDALRAELEPLGGFPDLVPHAGIGTPLVYAVYHGPRSLIEGLLAAGADPDLDDGDGFPPLIAALTSGRDDRIEIVEVLLRSGADPDRHGINDDTALHLAATDGDLPLVELLLRHGADPNVTTRIDDVETPVESAQRAGHEAVVHRLRPLTTRLDWEGASRAGDVATLQRMVRDGQAVDALDANGQSALMRAAHAGRTEAVEWLAAQGADLDRTAKFGLSALMLAVIGGHAATARALVRAGADASLTGSGAPGFAGRTAADLAAERGDRRLAVDLRID